MGEGGVKILLDRVHLPFYNSFNPFFIVGAVVCGYLQDLGIERDLAKEEQLATKGTDEQNRSQISTARYPSPGIVERSLQRKIRRLAGLLIALSLVPGIALVVSPDNAPLVPPSSQWSAYLISITLLVAAWSLLQDRHNSEAGPDPGTGER
jgi:hypothetical protein